MSTRRLWATGAVVLGLLLAGGTLAFAGGLIGGGDDTPVLRPGAEPPEEAFEEILARDAWFMSRRTAGEIPLDNQQAGAFRAAAVKQVARLRKEATPGDGPHTFAGGWTAIGPNPIVQNFVYSGSPHFGAMAGRIGALAIRPSTGTFILGGAQGGVWTYDPATQKWSTSTDGMESLAIGALAVAPTNDAIVYAGTGEGHLSGDSYFGNGVLKSTDGGSSWTHVSGDYFRGVSTSRIVVDPGKADHLYAAIIRGRGGSRRTTPAVHSRYGVWESNDAGATWTLLKEAKSELNGATDLEIDPVNPQILYATFWGDGIYKSTDGGKNWVRSMTGLPGSAADYAANSTRIELGLSHPAGQSAVLYAGFDWIEGGAHHDARIFKSTDEGASWTMLPAGAKDGDSVEGYCGTQCTYDNNVDVDPTDPNIVHVGGMFGYAIGSGGTFRSDDGGQTWKDLGYEQHPDFQAFAFNPSNPSRVLQGSDGGVWTSADRGGRLNADDPLEANTWQNLNGTIDQATLAATVRTNLQIAQFTSIATTPQIPGSTAGVGGRFWGGTQDNGTLRKSGGNPSWFDMAAGDGGQVIVDHTPSPAGSCTFAPSCMVWGTYFGISPYRFSDGGAQFFGNQYIRNGINLNDRATFYIPLTVNRLNPDQLFTGTYRLYRSDNARAQSAGDVRWKPISGDLTEGCSGTAPNGARSCTLSAIGVGGGNAVYTGSEDGSVYMSPDAQKSDSPAWVRSGVGELPKRPVTQFAVDRSNYRIAYIAYAGFNAASPNRPGHVFKTTNGGGKWVNISGDLPDTPVNSVVLDPSYPNTLYAGTDVGPFVTYNGGANWHRLGSAFPNVAVWQLDLDPYNRVLAAGSHGRGGFKSVDTQTTVPALVVSKVDAGVPVGPTSNLTYKLTLRNIGNADATGVTITDPIPANTSFVSASDGGTFANGKVTWTGLSVPKGAPGAGGSIEVSFTVSIADAIKSKVKSIVNDGVVVTSGQGVGTTGSPAITPIAPPFAAAMTPATQTDGARVGQTVSYTVTVRNLGFNTDTYAMSSTGGTFPVSFFDATCTTPLTTTPSVDAGMTTNVCVKVDVPAGAANEAASTATVVATSVGNPAVSASAAVKTIAVAVDTLLVDNDTNAPRDSQPYYKAMLAGANVTHSTWDLNVDKTLPVNYVRAFRNVVWFTGNSWPQPITPYEPVLKAFLDNGGRLLMSGQDILDQNGGTTQFVHDYLHINWDGSETQNDKRTEKIHPVAGSPISDGLSAVTLNHAVLNAQFENRITPIAPATAAFQDDTGAPDALSFADASAPYKVVFLAFPLEGYGTPADLSVGSADQIAVINRVMAFFGP